jgi:hypothetical protein
LPSTSIDVELYGANICLGIGVETKLVFVLIASMAQPSIEVITTGPTAALGTFEQVQVAGFPGVVEPLLETDLRTVDTDVAAGQFVGIDYRDGHRPTRLSRDELCQGAIAFGEEIVAFHQETSGHSWRSSRGAALSCPNRPRRQRPCSTVVGMRRLLVLLAAVGVVAGCSTSIPGVPSPVAGSTATPGPTAGGLALPPRPRELKLDGIDPCSSLTPSQLATLGLDRTVPSVPIDFGDLNGTICSAGGFGAKKFVSSFVFVTHPGIEHITAGPIASLGKFEVVEVAGFPGVVEPSPETDACSVDIDVASGQFISVQNRAAGGSPPLTRAELCASATSVSEAIMNSLLGK